VTLLPLAAALLGALPSLALAQVAILHIQVMEGEGAVNQPGSRAARPLIVEITDETGKPVAGAAVSFHLPEDGPGGAFASGLRTDVALTDDRGRAACHSVQWNRTPGKFAIRIVASRDQARAGAVSFQYVAEPKAGATAKPAPRMNASLLRGFRKWVAVAALAGGAAAVGVLAADRSGSSGSNSTVTAPAIGAPAITIGKP